MVDKFSFTTNEFNEHCDFVQAKQCALIACAEVLKQWEYIDTHIADLGGQLSPNYKFWLEVEQGINQL